MLGKSQLGKSRVPDTQVPARLEEAAFRRAGRLADWQRVIERLPALAEVSQTD